MYLQVFLLAVAVSAANCTGDDSWTDYTHVVQKHEPSSEYCKKTYGECSLITYRDTSNMTHMEVSCYCYIKETDVSGSLNDIVEHPCPLVPRAGQLVDFASLNITRCYVQRQTVPQELLLAVRRTRRLILWFQEARLLRLPLHQNDMLGAPLDTVAMMVTNSSLSGIGRGLVSGCQKLRLVAQHSNIGVIRSSAFAHYDSDNADVEVKITDAKINKFTKDSVQLPMNGRLVLESTRIDSIDGGAISGAGEVSLVSSVVAITHTGAVNMAEMNSFKLIGCKMASVLDRAVISKRAIDGADTSSNCSLTVNNSELIRVAAGAFMEACRAAKVTWQNNVIVDVYGGPLLLEEGVCMLPPSSIITPSSITCSNCSIFTDISEHMCPVYASSWCSACQPSTVHCPISLEDYLSDQCSSTVLNRFRSVCPPRQGHFPSTPRHPRTEGLNGGGATLALSWGLMGLAAVRLAAVAIC